MLREFAIVYGAVGLLTAPGLAGARDRDLGLGLILGEPTGVSGKLWLGRATAVDGAVVRFPVELAYIFEGSRFDAFMEAAPTLDVAPRTDVDISAGIGVRYYFP